MMTLSLFGTSPSLNSIANALTAATQQQNRVIAWWVWVILVIVLILIILIFSNPPKEDLKDMEKTLMPEQAENPEVPVVAAAALAPDDLKKIEGIGPKISQVLQSAGLLTFAQLADATPSAIQSILDDAGIRLANPETWPQQARLAANGKWEELAALQDSLTGGRRAA